MRSILLGLAVTACGGSGDTPPPPAPVVHTLSPQTGLWGTSVTIDGANFGVQGSGTVAFSGSAGANGFEVDSWNDTEIRGRVAFPATGDMAVHTANGTAAAGTFTTTEPWTPSAAFDVAQLEGGLVVSTGDVAAIYHEYQVTNLAALAVLTGANAGAYPLDGLVDPQDATAPVIAKLIEADDHTPLVIATKRDNTVVAFGSPAGTLVTTPTGLTGAVVATARDPIGLYAWIYTTSGLVRARPGTPWTVDRGPITTPYPPLDGAVAADGSLWVVVSEPGASSTAFVSVAVLPPTATQLGALERADPTSHPTTIARAYVLLAGDGIHAVVLATADVAGPLTPRLRTAPATWSDAPAVTGLAQYAFIGSVLAAIVNDPAVKSTSLVPDVTMPSGAQVIPVWPMQSEGVVIDAAGGAHPLVTNGSVTYALTSHP